MEVRASLLNLEYDYTANRALRISLEASSCAREEIALQTEFEYL